MAIRDPELKARYLARQREVRAVLAAGLEARARQLGAPEGRMSADELARVTLSVIGGLPRTSSWNPDRWIRH